MAGANPFTRLTSHARTRLAAGILALAAPLLATLSPALAQSAFQTAAPSAILVDFATGAILFEKDSEKPFAPGGTVKIMTALVVFEEIRHGKITPDSTFVVSENAWRRGGGPSGGAAMFVPLKNATSVKDLLVGMITVGGNDAAITLAEGVAGTEGAFSLKMNEMGQVLGLTGSDFRNSTGFADPAQKSTARDMAQISRYIIRTYPEFYPYFSVPDIEWSKVKQRNRNALLNAGVGADGLQLAWIKDGGYHLVGSAQQNNQRLIVAVMGAKSEKERLDEAKRLLEWGFHSFEHRQLFAGDVEIGRATVFGGTQGSVGLKAPGPVTLLMPRNSQDKLVAKVTYAGPLKAPVAKGAEVARLEISRGPLKVMDVPLLTMDEVPVGTLWQRAIDGAGVLVGDTARDLGQKVMAKLGK